RNAFIACNHIHCADSRVSIFMLCNFCDEVTETVDETAAAMLEQLCAARGFTGKRQVIEISGTCRDCAGASH
ncbi:MAG: transcriptional repressor, partial [Alphaproteobacteria bacterium]|nr:transcriptional repressor [Alphaproteobacteria bacterium]